MYKKISITAMYALNCIIDRLDTDELKRWI